LTLRSGHATRLTMSASRLALSKVGERELSV
jgi:hypothetical protein